MNKIVKKKMDDKIQYTVVSKLYGYIYSTAYDFYGSGCRIIYIMVETKMEL